MTLPAVVGKYKEKVFISQAKKSVSIVNNALNLAKAKESVSSYEDLFIANATSDESADIIFKNMQVVERCKSNKTGCGSEIVIKPQYRTNDGYGNVSNGGALRNFSRAILKDGTIVGVYQAKYARGGCSHDYTAYKKDSNGNYVKDDDGNLIPELRTETCCAKIYFDINGEAGPNQYGQDVFIIYITPSGYIQSSGSINNVLANEKLYFENYTAGGSF